ncbi:hypothetical protein COOONC_17448 [Cooperia oncophora]
MIFSWERHSGMLDWYADQFNFVVFSTGVHPQDRSQLILQFRPPDLSEIIGPIRADLIKIANPGPTELEPLLQVQIRQNLSNDPVLSLISPDELQRQNMLEDVAQLMLDIDKVSSDYQIVFSSSTREPGEVDNLFNILGRCSVQAPGALENVDNLFNTMAKTKSREHREEPI